MLRATAGFDGCVAGAQITDFASIYELRPWQGVRIFWPRAEINPRHLIRLEERFFFDTDVIFRFRIFQAF